MKILCRLDMKLCQSIWQRKEWQTRVDLAAAYRIVHHHGWTSQVYNQFTARITNTERLLINPLKMLSQMIPHSESSYLKMEHLLKPEEQRHHS